MFCYKVHFFDKFDQKTKTDSGLVAANDYGTAANKLVDFYGKENIKILGLYEVNDILLQDEIIEMLDDKFDI